MAVGQAGRQPVMAADTGGPRPGIRQVQRHRDLGAAPVAAAARRFRQGLLEHGGPDLRRLGRGSAAARGPRAPRLRGGGGDRATPHNRCRDRRGRAAHAARVLRAQRGGPGGGAKHRRDALAKQAVRFYEFLAKQVDVRYATDIAENVDVERGNGGDVMPGVYKVSW